MIVLFCQAERGLAVVGRRGEVRAAVQEELARRRVAAGSRPMERGPAVLGLGGEVRAAVQEERARRRVAADSRQVERGPAVLVLGDEVRAAVQEELARRRVAAASRRVERGPAVLVHGGEVFDLPPSQAVVGEIHLLHTPTLRWFQPPSLWLDATAAGAGGALVGERRRRGHTLVRLASGEVVMFGGLNERGAASDETWLLEL